MAYHIVSSSHKRQSCAQKHLELTMVAAWMLGSHCIFQEYQDIAFLLGYFLAALLLITLSSNSTFILQHIKIHNNWVGVHSQQTEESEAAWGPWPCKRAHRGVCWLRAAHGLTWWAFSSQHMAGLFMGRSPGFPCHAAAGNYPAHWKPCWHETDFVTLWWGVSSASSRSDSAPWVASDSHKRPCQISFLFDLMHFWGYGSPQIPAAAWVAAERLGWCWQVLYQCTTANCFLKKTVLLLSGCGAAQVRSWADQNPWWPEFWKSALAEQCRKEKQWKNTPGCTGASFGGQASEWEASLPAVGCCFCAWMMKTLP